MLVSGVALCFFWCLGSRSRIYLVDALAEGAVGLQGLKNLVFGLLTRRRRRLGANTVAERGEGDCLQVHIQTDRQMRRRLWEGKAGPFATFQHAYRLNNFHVV